MLALWSEHNEVERRDRVELPRLGVDGVEVGQGVGRAGHIPDLRRPGDGQSMIFSKPR